MKKTITAITLALGLMVTTVVPAVAADLSNANGQTCQGAGTWHFVNNQTEGAAAGTLTAMFNNGAITVVVDTYKVLKRVQHFNVTTDGNATLTSASTNLPGRLVLSDFSCDDTPKKK